MHPICPVPFTAVSLSRGFWAERIATNRARTIPVALDRCHESGRLWNVERAAAVLRGEPIDDRSAPGYPFDDTDVYKVLEGAAYALAVEPDPELEARLDEIVQKVAAAQEGDGYLFTTRTIDPASPHPWAGTERWQLETHLSHELYNLGHLIEAAVAHHDATGKRGLLDVALRAARLLTSTFGRGKRSIWPGHQITEMALVRLYRAIGDPGLLELARYLLEERAPDGKPGSADENNQSHARVVDQTEAVGHAVRATYMYAGMADVAAEQDAPALVAALRRIWDDIVSRKLYVTGGIGARPIGEAFGAAYELPNLTAYNETCAAIGLVYFCHRMFLLSGDGRAIDVLERVLYNGLIAGVGLDGESFFYPNPLESFGEYARSPWFGCACCPGNVARFMASVPGYVCARRGDSVYVNLYAPGSVSVELDRDSDGASSRLVLLQETNYPWDGLVRIEIREPAAPRELELRLRIPGWARGEVVPSDLYRFVDEPNAAEPELRVNGAGVAVEMDAGYAVVRRQWRRGDTLELRLPMRARRIEAHPAVEANRGRVALQRGPIVYALEAWDQDGREALNLVVADSAVLESSFRADLLGGTVTISGPAVALSRSSSGELSQRQTRFTAIPYFAWANRGPCEMLVWVARSEAHAWIRPAPTLASQSTVTASGGDCWLAANDLAPAASSRDESHKRTRLAPGADGKIWIEYAFPAASRVSEAFVYWFEATDWRREGPPAEWQLSYRRDDRWVPVAALGAYGIELDEYNRVEFEAVVTSALRLEVTAPPGRAVGLLEWQVR